MRTTNACIERFATFINLNTTSSTKLVAIIIHEFQLLFKFFWEPQVITIKECYPFAFCFSKSKIAAVGSATITVIFKVMNRFAPLAMTLLNTSNYIVGVVSAGVIDD